MSRLAGVALQRGSSATARRAPLHSCLASVRLHGQHTLGSASLPLARHVRALDGQRLVEVAWEDGGQSLYPLTWLRDNCQCPQCTLHSAKARKLSMSDLDVDTGVDVVEVTSDNKVSVYFVISSSVSRMRFTEFTSPEHSY